MISGNFPRSWGRHSICLSAAGTETRVIWFDVTDCKRQSRNGCVFECFCYLLLHEDMLICQQAPYEIERRKQDNEMERLQSLPEWKRNLIVKKRTGDAI